MERCRSRTGVAPAESELSLHDALAAIRVLRAVLMRLKHAPARSSAQQSSSMPELLAVAEVRGWGASCTRYHFYRAHVQALRSIATDATPSSEASAAFADACVDAFTEGIDLCYASASSKVYCGAGAVLNKRGVIFQRRLKLSSICSATTRHQQVCSPRVCLIKSGLWPEQYERSQAAVGSGRAPSHRQYCSVWQHVIG